VADTFALKGLYVHSQNHKAERCRLFLQVQILLQRRGLSLNPITTMYYIAPVSFAFLSIPWGFIEARQLFADEKVGFGLLVTLFCTLASLTIKPEYV